MFNDLCNPCGNCESCNKFYKLQPKYKKLLAFVKTLISDKNWSDLILASLGDEVGVDARNLLKELGEIE